MKKYTKTIDGKQVIKPANKIVIVKDGTQTFNPTEEMILNDGWTEYVPVVEEPTEEEIFNREKEHMIEEIMRYDSSEEVNIFYVQNIPMWLDKATRAGLMLRFQAETAIGETETSLWYNSMEFKLPIETATQMLYAIEVYASKCYDKTQYHIAEVSKITDIDELRHYDYRHDYPEKLSF
jgi:hypothetical protein